MAKDSALPLLVEMSNQTAGSAFRWRIGPSYRYCERVARSEAANFYHAFRLLPGPQRQSMCALYSFFRKADDIADGPESVEVKRQNLLRWREQFCQAVQGQFSHAMHPALHHTVVKHQIPRSHLEAALDGVEMDLSVSSYATFEDLYGYCYRVASVVGLSCIHVWGCPGTEGYPFAEAAGIAFQLTNILRDLGEDAARGRTYLPLRDLEKYGYSIEDLRESRVTPGFRELMKDQVARARSYYERAEPLVGMLPAPGRAVFLVMFRTYRGLLDVIERQDYDVFTSRARLTKIKKLWLVLQALPVRWGWY